MREVVEEAIRQYVEASAITDVDSMAIAETQESLLKELPPVDDWKAGKS